MNRNAAGSAWYDASEIALPPASLGRKMKNRPHSACTKAKGGAQGDVALAPRFAFDLSRWLVPPPPVLPALMYNPSRNSTDHETKAAGVFRT